MSMTIAEQKQNLLADTARRAAELDRIQAQLESEAARISQSHAMQTEAAGMATARREASETLQTVLAAHSERWAQLRIACKEIQDSVIAAHIALETTPQALAEIGRYVDAEARSLGNDCAGLVPLLGRDFVVQALSDLVRDSEAVLDLSDMHPQQKRAYHIHGAPDVQGAWRTAAGQLPRG